MARCLERPTVDPLLPQRAIIDELTSNSAEARVRANDAVYRASAAVDRANRLMKEMRRLGAQAHAAAAAHHDGNGAAPGAGARTTADAVAPA